MIGGPPLRMLAGGARSALALTANALRHAAWYVRYQVDGSARERRR